MWHILGVGAIGMRWARKLVLANEPVELVFRNEAKLSEYLAAGAGVQFTDREQSEYIKFQATHLEAEQLEIDNLILCTKSYSLIEAYTAVTGKLKPGANLVLLCNGYGPQQVIAENTEAFNVWGASTTSAANAAAPFKLYLAGDGTTLIGALNNRAKQAPCPLLNLPRHSETDEIDKMLWRKLAINACINPLTALHKVRNGELVDNANLQAHMHRLAIEIEELASALSRPLHNMPLIEAANIVCKKTAQNRSSMLQDVENGRRTEIEEITGTLVRLAEEVQVDLTENSRILQQFTI